MNAGSLTGITPYWIYLIYAIGAVGLWVIGHRKWWGWLILAPTRVGAAVTGYLTGVTWVVMGSITYLVVDLYCLFTWRHREKFEDQAAHRFVDLVSGRFAEGKKEAIHELIQLQHDIDELTGAGTFGRRGKDEQLLNEYLRSQDEHDREGKQVGDLP